MNIYINFLWNANWDQSGGHECRQWPVSPITPATVPPFDAISTMPEENFSECNASSAPTPSASVDSFYSKLFQFLLATYSFLPFPRWHVPSPRGGGESQAVALSCLWVLKLLWDVWEHSLLWELGLLNSYCDQARWRTDTDGGRMH